MIKNITPTKYGDLKGMVWNELFQTEIVVSISSEAKFEYANRCAEYFSNMPDDVVDRLCTYCIRYCEEMQNLMIEEGFEEGAVVPEDVKGREILSYITPSVLIIEDKCDENIIEFHVECECDWEEEHGLEITIKDNKLLYVGSFDGMPPYYEERLAYVGYYDKENDMNMYYVDKE